MQAADTIGQYFKCSRCGNIVSVTHNGGGILICCGMPMEALEEKENGFDRDLHKAVIEKRENQLIVRVGEAKQHPMEKNHYIEWIEIKKNNFSCTRFLTPNMQAEAMFKISEYENIEILLYCNKHGLWKN